MKRLNIHFIIFVLLFSLVSIQPSSTLAQEAIKEIENDVIVEIGEGNVPNEEERNSTDLIEADDLTLSGTHSNGSDAIDEFPYDVKNPSETNQDNKEQAPINKGQPAKTNTYNTFSTQSKANIQESKISRLGHIRSQNVDIHETLGGKSFKAGTTLTNAVYYIKKQAIFENETYYLLSTRPSDTTGTIGWAKASDLSTHAHTGVDKRVKTFIIKGNGKATTKAWGGSKDTVYPNLSKYKDSTFRVHLTEKVGNNTWYRGTLDGKTVWLHSSYLTSVAVSKSKTSRLGHIRNQNVDIHESLGGKTFKAGATLTNAVYYIKEQATYKNQLYYLLSTRPSSEKGIIGWARASDLSTHVHVGVDKKVKTFLIKGNGKATTKAWGGNKDTVYENLSKYKNSTFRVHLTEKVGNNTWYRGTLDGNTVWLHSSYLTSAAVSKSKTSRLGHIRNANINIHESLGGKTFKAGATLTNAVYYIKEQAIYGSERYYLLSTRPSSTKGVIGWAKASDLSTHSHVGVDKKVKTFYIKGNGKATTKAWGGNKDTVYTDLSKYNNAPFRVHLTEKVGNNTWYRGTLDGKTVWLHSSYLYSATKSKTSKLGHIRSQNVDIHETLGGKKFKAGTTYTNAVYYIKEQATYKKQLYYLLSTNPSSIKGVIGWAKASDLSTHPHAGVDKKAKTFFIKGNGKATTKAWGGQKDTVYTNLSTFKDEVFNVHLTEKVGNNTWYRGILDGKTVWLHSSYVKGDYVLEVALLTNKERTKHNLAPLIFDPELSKVAQEKSRDMRVNNYFDHESPTYGSPYDMMDRYGIKYTAAAENIALGQETPEWVVNSWMNSPGHRANILDEDFTHIGIGYEKQGNYWTQMFIRK